MRIPAAAWSMTVTVLLSACGTASTSRLADAPARKPLPEVAASLYRFVVAAQIEGDVNPRFDGGWPAHARLDLPLPITRRESDLFTPLQIALNLHEAAATYELPGLAGVDDRLAPMVEAYLDDARRTAEPAGSIGYWALYDTIDGGQVHYPDQPLLITPLARIIDIPNDLDTASQASLWLERTGRRSDFRAAYQAMLGDWRDRSSGAFLTWNDPDRSTDARSRIPTGTNDVDCVVNLNVLHSLAGATASELPAATAAGRDSACALVSRAMSAGLGSVCATYYDDRQFHLAFARALTGGVGCLAPLLTTATASTRDLARGTILDDTVDALGVAEVLLTLKLLHPPPRDGGTTELVDLLTERLNRLVEPRGNGMAALPESFLYRGAFDLGTLPVRMKVEWRSQAMATGTALLALLAD